jgi:hypothetical protein
MQVTSTQWAKPRFAQAKPIQNGQGCQLTSHCHQLPCSACFTCSNQTHIHLRAATNKAAVITGSNRHTATLVKYRSLISTALVSSSVPLTEKYYSKVGFIRHVRDQTVAGYRNVTAVRAIHLMCILLHLATLRTDLTIQFATRHLALFSPTPFTIYVTSCTHF